MSIRIVMRFVHFTGFVMNMYESTRYLTSRYHYYCDCTALSIWHLPQSLTLPGRASISPYLAFAPRFMASCWSVASGYFDPFKEMTTSGSTMMMSGGAIGTGTGTGTGTFGCEYGQREGQGLRKGRHHDGSSASGCCHGWRGSFSLSVVVRIGKG